MSNELRDGAGMLNREDGRLTIEGHLVEDLAERYGSPLFVVSEPALRARAREFQRAFGAAWPDGPVVVMPAIKANPVLALQRILAEEGCGCDLFGGSELEVAVRAGIDPDRISVNGTAKDRQTLERAVSIGARITIDDVHEIAIAREAARAVGKPARLRVRLRPEIEDDALSDGNALLAVAKQGGLKIRDAYARYKPGIPGNDLDRVGAEIAAPEIELVGAMMHFPRHTTDLRVVGHVAERFAALIADVAERWDWLPDSIDVGGGFSYPEDPFGRGHPELAERPPGPEIEEYATTIGTHLRQALERHGIDSAGRRLELEPGRALFGPVGVHLATVLNVKRQTVPVEHTWVETDTTQHFMPGLALEWCRFPVETGRAAADSSALVADVVGRSCVADVLARAEPLPEVEPGELLCFRTTGAYQETDASNFNAMPRPATVLVEPGASQLVRRRETTGDVLSRDLIPDHLLAGA